MIPQMILLSLVFISVGVSIIKSGQPKTGRHSLLDNIIGWVLIITLLYWAGFFDNFYI
jgi:hypothetical protein